MVDGNPEILLTARSCLTCLTVKSRNRYEDIVNFALTWIYAIKSFHRGARLIKLHKSTLETIRQPTEKWIPTLLSAFFLLWWLAFLPLSSQRTTSRSTRRTFEDCKRVPAQKKLLFLNLLAGPIKTDYNVIITTFGWHPTRTTSVQARWAAARQSLLLVLEDSGWSQRLASSTVETSIPAICTKHVNLRLWTLDLEPLARRKGIIVLFGSHNHGRIEKQCNKVTRKISTLALIHQNCKQNYFII